MYAAIHTRHTLPGEGEKMDENKVAGFYADYGIEPERFLKTLHGFSVDSNIRRATSHMQESRIPSTPALVINGRYLVTPRSYSQVLDTANYLIELEHKAAE